jgi:hypothetical protein
MCNSDYFLRRANEEMAAAERATTPEAKRIHSQLANRYLEMIESRPAMPEAPAPESHLSG